jgi:hypothetical protein
MLRFGLKGMIKRQEQPTKTDEEINKSRTEDTNVDRDGRERQPTEQDQPELRDEGRPDQTRNDAPPKR